MQSERASILEERERESAAFLSEERKEERSLFIISSAEQERAPKNEDSLMLSSVPTWYHMECLGMKNDDIGPYEDWYCDGCRYQDDD